MATPTTPLSSIDAESALRNLESFLLENPELERLESLVEPFNIFEAVGIRRQELRHSNLLAFLVNPAENHGLGDAVAKRFLQAAIRNHGDRPLPFSAVELDLWDLDAMEVRREWKGIDIFFHDHGKRFMVILENKIGSGEHSDQLRRYWSEAQRECATCRVVGLYLTPEGVEPLGDKRYLAIDYNRVCAVIDAFLVGRGSTLGSELATLLRHYTQMLRRHVVEDSEVVELCRQIYRKHRPALDLIFEYRLDVQSQLREILESLIDASPELVKDQCDKSHVRFAPKGWDTPVLISKAHDWTSSGRMLLLEFNNAPERLMLGLYLGPGPIETRQRLFNALSGVPPFKPTSKGLNAKWNMMWQHRFLAPAKYEGAVEEMKTAIEREWLEFLGESLPQISEALKKEAWLWEVDSPTGSA